MFIMKWWRQTQRNIDKEVLFPQIVELGKQNKNEKAASQAILLHMSIDSAWKYPEEFSQDERQLVINLSSSVH